MGSSADALSHSLKLEFSTGPSEASVRMPLHSLTANYYGNVHHSLIAALPEYCASLFIAEVLGVRAQERCVNLRTINHTFHAATKIPVVAVIKLEDEDVVKLKERLGNEKRARLELEVEVRDDSGRRIASSTSAWIIDRPEMPDESGQATLGLRD